LGCNPVAALAFTLAIDFEGDQWTFFKFPHDDLEQLYGLEVHELAIWRPLVWHLEEQVGAGRPVLVELDSYHLPDTAGTAYQRAHVKSTVAVNSIDGSARKLGYFHNQGYHQLSGADFENVFRLLEGNPSDALPPYVEFVKRRPREVGEDGLEFRSQGLLRRHLQRIPETNPFDRFRSRFESDVPWLVSSGLETFHLYSFSTLRQFGACYELAATYLHWLQQRTLKPLDKPIESLTAIATGAKTLQFQLARAIGRSKPLDLSLLDNLSSGWRSAMTSLKDLFL
jgi:hypothetical protein